MVAISAVLVLALTGFAWRSVDNLIANIDRIGGLGLGGERDGAVDILLVGVDSRTDAHGNPLTKAERAMLHAGDEVGTNTDTIVLIRVPNDGRSATAISIPRDAYVDIGGQGKAKINSAYGSTKETERAELLADGKSEAEAERASTKAGRQALIKSVATLTGITVDHYAEVSLLGFVLLTDSVGGVEVCLNQAVDEPMSGADFPAGRQRLDGQEALSFVRQRHDLERGDIDRIVRQQVFMAQLVGQLLNAKILANPGKLSEISEAVGRTVVLDEDWDVLAFLQQLKDLSGGKVEFETIPVSDLNSMTSAGESVVKVDPKTVQSFVAGLVGEEEQEESAPKIDTSTVTVSVLNAGGATGLAGKVSAALTSKGFREGTVGNYTGGTVSSSRVLAADAADPKAVAVAEALGGLTVVADTTVSADTVSVVLASDYSGPGSAAAGMFDLDATSSATATPIPPAPPIDAGQNGPKCVN
ncbi:LCP family protein [Nocardia salmonicida]|uniref:LCP family protein n=1 Tax=Nocardia TaxID=1817 RepID=UPI00265933BC|nr:LCP family protein [Nocardia sp. PE-7]WKG13376.1 LCP family protein [Nocardia sp. PE-7]